MTIYSDYCATPGCPNKRNEGVFVGKYCYSCWRRNIDAIERKAFETIKGTSHMATIYLLMWRYNDSSAFGVVRAFESRDSAEELMRLFEEQGCPRVYEIFETELQELL